AASGDGGVVVGGDHHAELGDDLAQGFGLGAELFGGRGAFFGVSGGVLRDLFDLRDGLADLLDAARLLFAALADAVDEDLDAARLLGDGAHGDGDLIDLVFAAGGLGDGVRDEGGGVLGGLSAALGEVANLFGDDGEAHASLAGAGGFD